MKKNKYVFVAAMLITMLLVGFIFTNLYVMQQPLTAKEEYKEGDISIVTSFYPVYIATLNIVGDTQGVHVENLSEPKTGCLHDYTLTTADMKLLSSCDVFVVNGGGIESFLEDVTKAYPSITVVEACKDVQLLEETAQGHHHEEEEEEHEDEHVHEHAHEGEEEMNAHGWMSVETYKAMIKSITNQLVKADPKHAASYRKNAKVYDTKLTMLQKEQEECAEFLNGFKIISFHSAFSYVAKDYGMDVVCCIDFDEERPVSAGEVAQILEAIQHDGATLILAERLYGEKMAEAILSEDDVEVAVLYLNPLNKGDNNPDSYLLAMQENIDVIKEMMEAACEK